MLLGPFVLLMMISSNPKFYRKTYEGMVDKGSSGSGSGYPAPLAKYEEVVADPQLFMVTLEKFHATMATKFM